jgi:hypothetical protein
VTETHAVENITAMLHQMSPEHALEFTRWVSSTYTTKTPYTGGRTAWFANDGTGYDLGGPSTVYLRTENSSA